MRESEMTVMNRVEDHAYCSMAEFDDFEGRARMERHMRQENGSCERFEMEWSLAGQGRYLLVASWYTPVDEPVASSYDTAFTP
jgi:hypothetical protein